MERTALGFGRLSAAQFDAFTPKEVQWRIEAEQGREDREFERIAQLACWVMNPWIDGVQHKMSVSKLLKRRMVQPLEGDALEQWMKD